MSLTGRVHCHHNLVKHLGDWTQAGRFEVKARRAGGSAEAVGPDRVAGLARSAEWLAESRGYE